MSTRPPSNGPPHDTDYPAAFPPPLPVESPAGMYTTSPSSLTHALFDSVDKEDPLEVHPLPRCFMAEFMDLQCVLLSRLL